MLTNLVRYGRDYAIVIPHDAIETYDIAPGTDFELSFKEGSIVLTPRPEIGEERFQKAVEFLLSRYGNAMKKLADHDNES